MASVASDQGEVSKAWEDECTSDGGHKECRIDGHEDIWQNPQDKAQINKDNAPTVLNQLWLGKKRFQQGQTMATHSINLSLRRSERPSTQTN